MSGYNKTITLVLSREEYEQFRVDLEQAREEITELSGQVDWFCSEMPERLTTILDILEMRVGGGQDDCA